MDPLEPNQRRDSSRRSSATLPDAARKPFRLLRAPLPRRLRWTSLTEPEVDLTSRSLTERAQRSQLKVLAAWVDKLGMGTQKDCCGAILALGKRLAEDVGDRARPSGSEARALLASVTGPISAQPPATGQVRRPALVPTPSDRGAARVTKKLIVAGHTY